MLRSSFFRLSGAVRYGLLPMSLAAAVYTVQAQSNRGTVTGTVQDSTGAVVPNAEVTLKSPSQGTTTVLQTNSAGVYRFDGVNAGDYVVIVKAAGFQGAEIPASVVVGSTVGRDFTLNVGSSSDVVEVTSNALELQTEDAVRSQTIPAQQLIELPLAGQNSLNLILTAPGVVRSNQGGSLDTGIGAVNGARARSNNYLIDGLQNNDISVAGPQYVITNNDVLQEVNFQTSNFSPEFGRAGGAVISQITKSGTNQIHGTVAAVYRSQLFSATTQLQRSAYLSNLAAYNTQIAAGNTNFPVPVAKNVFHEFRPAITIGGPVVIPGLYNGRDRTFLFGGGQLFRDRYNALATFTNVPTAAGYATLNAYKACPNVVLYLNLLNAVGNPTSSFQQSAPSIAVPTSLASTTCTNNARTGQVLSLGQFYRSAKENYNDDNFVVRLDHKASNKQSLLFRFLFDDNSDNLGGSEALGAAFDVPSRGRTMGSAFNDVYQIKNSLVNEFRFGFTRSSVRFNIPDSATLGASLPQFSVTGVNLPAITSSFNQGRIANSFEYEDVLTYVKGKHAFKGGAAFLRQLAVQVAPFNGRGTIVYSQITPQNASNSGGLYTTAITAVANFFDDVAGVNTAPVSKLFDTDNPAQPGTYRPNLFTQSYFLQDTWKLTPDLTLVYGFRYENFGQPANSLPRPAFVGYGTNDYLSTARVHQDNNNIGPTFGFSYNPHLNAPLLSGRTVIRGGYQVTYDTFFNNLLSNMKGASPNSPSNLTTASAVTPTTPRGTPGISTALATAVPTLNPYTAQQSVFPQNIRNPYYHHFSLGVQEQMAKRIVLDVAYVGSLGRQLFFTDPINPGVPNTSYTQTATQATAYGTQTLRLNPNRGNIQIRAGGLTSNYHSLQVQVRHTGLETPVGRVFFSEAYTWSKNLDVLSETFASNSSPQNPSRSPALPGVQLGYLDYGPADNDRRHVSSTVINWAIRGPQNGLLNRIFGGWSLAPILTAQSGTPYTVLNGTDRDLDGSSNGDRPNIGNPKAPFNSRGVQSTTCGTGIADAVSGSCVTADQVRFILVNTYQPTSTAIEGRNSQYTTRYLNLDADILKKIKIRERVNAELRGEFLNATNNQNFDTPSAYKDLTQYGGSSSFLDYTLQSGGARTFRLGAKVLF